MGHGNYGFDGIRYGATALANGNYVFGSYLWQSNAGRVGAVTWGNGVIGSTGVVSSANSLVGSTNFDSVGFLRVTELTNGSYVVRTPGWDAITPAVQDVGAATWGNGATGTAGIISPANSLVGSQVSDNVGTYVVALTNGNYVAQNFDWDSASALNVGAVTWGNGVGGTVGVVSAANSLVGESVDDAVGVVVPLANGNYIVSSYSWNVPSPEVVDAGAVTWGNGLGGTVGKVSAANSIVGSTANDFIGISYNSYALSNGNYVVASPGWDNGLIVDAGAVTWGNGNTGSKGVLSAANSLIGTNTNDLQSYIRLLGNGNYVVSSPSWDGAAVNVGAATFGNGNGGTVGPISANNSLVGSTANDSVGGVFLMGVDKYAAISAMWDNGAIVDAGAITFAGKLGISGPINASNSLLGIGNPGARPVVVGYDSTRNHLFVNGVADNTVTIFGDNVGAMFANGFE